MKIRIKILLGYVLLAGLVLFVGLVGYRATHAVGAGFESAINRSQPVLQALQTIRFEVVKLQRDAHVGLHPRRDESPHDVRLAPEALNAAEARYHSLVQTYFPDEREQAEEVAARLAEFRQALAQAGRSDAAETFVALSASVEAVLGTTAEAAAGELAEFEAYQEDIEREILSQERAIVAAGLAAFVLALFSGAKISSRVARPVIALREAVRRFGRGQLDTRVEIEDDTEVGELAHAFNSMAEQLAGTMVSRQYVEDIIDSMAEGMIVVTDDGRIERTNQAFRTLFRCGDDYSFAGRSASDYLPDALALEDALSRLAPRRRIETRMRTADGELLLVALSVAGLHSPGAAGGVVVLVQDVTERKRNEERLSYLARYDSLTGLPNRTLLLDHMGQSLARQPWKKGHTAVLFCDLDRFKFVNDTLGHGAGDLLLQRVSERLQACVRPGDIVARWSGDEFVVLLNDIAHFEDVEPLAARAIDVLDEPIQIGAHELYITASIGVAVAPEHASHADELVKCADMAMYAAKAEGKNTYRFYARGMAERSQERLQLERELRRALQEGGQLHVHYQAQQLLDGPLIGFEALVRWRHPSLGLISPANFLPTAEEAGLMAAIDETVLRIACEQARQWQQSGLGELRISVNVSDHLFRRGDLPALVGELLAEYRLPPSAIELELTEAIVMTDVESSIRTMQRIRELGVELSIDDFGTGYSSLAHLKRCPIQMLKIDRSFVNDVMTDPNDAAITEAITALAHKMGIRVIAEGVETTAQLEALRQYGCDALQGYLLSKPIPADALPEFLLRVGHIVEPAPPDSRLGERAVG